MSSKVFRKSLKEVPLYKIEKAKLFTTKLKHHRNLSISVPAHPNIFSSKKLSKKNEELDNQRSIIFSVNSNSLQQMSSFGTNNKSNEIKERKNSKKKIFVLNEIEMSESLDTENKQKTKRRKSNSQKNIFPHIPKKIYNIKQEANEQNDFVISLNKNEVPEIAENYLILPSKLIEQLQKPELNLVNPNKNIEGNYSNYINGVADSLKNFVDFDYDSIFDENNNKNVKYLYYTTPMDIEDIPKKKLLLIDLDETLVHSEFRNKDNFKALDYYTKNSKCQSKTFTYEDDNYIYYIDVFFRPFLKEFLDEVSKYFDLAIFTAAMKGYADTIIDYIDPKNEFFQFRLYRNACIPIQQRLYIKDLRIIKNYDPMNVILMDNSLYSFLNQPSNGMLVNSFYTNHKDTQLISATKFLVNHIFPCEDIRKECEKWYHFTDLFYKGTSKEKKEN